MGLGSGVDCVRVQDYYVLDKRVRRWGTSLGRNSKRQLLTALKRMGRERAEGDGSEGQGT